jgi:uncharacterized protein (TIGR02145 family)
VAGCNDDPDTSFRIQNQDATEVNPNMELTADEATLKLVMSSGAAWTIVPLEGTADWVTFDPDHGGAADIAFITLTVAENRVMEPRSTRFAVRQGNTDKFTISITQEKGIPLAWPKSAYQLLLEADAQQQQPVAFSWDDPPAGATAAALLFSKNPDMSSPITVTTSFSGSACTLTAAQLQALQAVIEDPANGLKRYYKNELYWNVRLSNNTFLSPEKGRMLYLSGQRLFTDVRGAETMVYAVTVIENPKECPTYKGIWMAQNLKTKRFLDGDEIVPEGDGTTKTLYEAPFADMDTTEYVEAGIMTPFNNPRNGYYYRPVQYSANYWVDYDAGIARSFVPEGWKIPESADWQVLLDAIIKAGKLDVVLDPEVYYKPEYGAWGLNLSPVGYYDTWPVPGVWHNGFDDGLPRLSYLMPQDNLGWSVLIWGVNSYEWNFNFIPIRFKYIADEE